MILTSGCWTVRTVGMSCRWR